MALPDIAKIAAIVGVVTVYVTARPNEEFHILTDQAWLVTTAIETALRWCVPLLVMVSGLLLLTARTASQPPADFYRRRAARVAIPLIGWSLFACVFNELQGIPVSFEEHIQTIYAGVPYYHFYFLCVIAGLYLICPLLARAISALSQRQLAITSIVALALGFLWGGVCRRGCLQRAATRLANLFHLWVTFSPAAGWPGPTQPAPGYPRASLSLRLCCSLRRLGLTFLFPPTVLNWGATSTRT